MNNTNTIISFLLEVITRCGALSKVKITKDKDIWLTSQKGHHFKLDTETGAVKAGFGGKIKNITNKPKIAKAKTTVQTPHKHTVKAQKADPKGTNALPSGFTPKHSKIYLSDSDLKFVNAHTKIFSYDAKNGQLVQHKHPKEEGNSGPVCQFIKTLLSPEEHSAVFDYTADDYRAIREAQKGKSKDPLMIQKAENLERAIRKLPHWDNPFPLYRGFILSPDVFTEFKKTMSDNIALGGFTSWSTQSSTAEEYATGKHNPIPHGIDDIEVVLTMHKIPKVAASIQGLSKEPQENEVGVSCDTKIRGKQITKTDINPETGRKRVYIAVEEYD